MRFEWPQATIDWFPDFLTAEETQNLFSILEHQTPWQGGSIHLFGKTHAIPRLECYYSIDGKTYGYSGRAMEVLPLPDYLMPILKRVELASKNQYNAVLLNYYRNERDSNGWHADDEKELGVNPVIASLSLGETRIFQCKHKTLPLRKNLELTSGSLLIMGGEMQHHWKHQIAKSTKPLGPRINLTFRLIK
jgi:alkylated DNA repair dioxygenase AlkB